MDRRCRDYYIVTFKPPKRFNQFWFIPQTEKFRDYFTIGKQLQRYKSHVVKVRWYSLNRKPYVLLSIRKQKTKDVCEELAKIDGIDQIVEYTQHKEKLLNDNREYYNFEIQRIRTMQDKITRLYRMLHYANNITLCKLLDKPLSMFANFIDGDLQRAASDCKSNPRFSVLIVVASKEKIITTMDKLRSYISNYFITYGGNSAHCTFENGSLIDIVCATEQRGRRFNRIMFESLAVMMKNEHLTACVTEYTKE